jgi:hypothetical protein
MRRFLLLMMVASSALRAQATTVVTCTLGSTTITSSSTSSSSCSIPFVVDGMPGVVSADASLSESIGTFTFISASADAGALPLPDVPFGASAGASDSLTFATAGPVRLGLIGVVASGFGVDSVASVGPYHIGTDDCCLPFELGSEFQVVVSAFAGAGGSSSHGSSSATLEFQLTDADGAPVEFFPVVIPEPATWGLLLFGLAACAVLHVRARRAGFRLGVKLRRSRRTTSTLLQRAARQAVPGSATSILRLHFSSLQLRRCARPSAGAQRQLSKSG